MTLKQLYVRVGFVTSEYIFRAREVIGSDWIEKTTVGLPYTEVMTKQQHSRCLVVIEVF